MHRYKQIDIEVAKNPGHAIAKGVKYFRKKCSNTYKVRWDDWITSDNSGTKCPLSLNRRKNQK